MKKNNLPAWKLFVTGFGLGYSPFAPGTMGAIGALVPALLFVHYARFPVLLLTALALICTIAGAIGSNKVEAEWGKDPPRVVIDEFVGMWISLIALPKGWLPLITGFGLFRLLDITKVLGIRKCESLRGGWGVMADDILAGIYTNLLLQMIFRLIPGTLVF
jgi:phosphatidylglycerophosphatase A